MVGDSFGLQYAKAINDSGMSVEAIFDLGRQIFPEYSRYRDNKEDKVCSSEYQKFKLMMDANHNRPVIIAQAWTVYKDILIKKNGTGRVNLDENEYFSILKEQLDKIFHDGGIGLSYYIIGFQQGAKNNAFSCLSSKNLPGFRLLPACPQKQQRQEIKVNYELKKIANEYENVKFIDPNDALCDEIECKVIIDNQPVHTDQSHLSIYGARPVMNLIRSSMKNEPEK